MKRSTIRRRSGAQRGDDVILALDMASQVGWAMCVATDVHFGSFNIAPLNFESPGRRYHLLMEGLKALAFRYGHPTLVIYEQPIRRGNAPTEYAIGCVAIVQMWCSLVMSDCVPINISSIKKHGAGHGHATKEAMLDAALKRWPDVKNDDEADALWLLDLWMTRRKESK